MLRFLRYALLVTATLGLAACGGTDLEEESYDPAEDEITDTGAALYDDEILFGTFAGGDVPALDAGEVAANAVDYDGTTVLLTGTVREITEAGVLVLEGESAAAGVVRVVAGPQAEAYVFDPAIIGQTIILEGVLAIEETASDASGESVPPAGAPPVSDQVQQDTPTVLLTADAARLTDYVGRVQAGDDASPAADSVDA